MKTLSGIVRGNTIELAEPPGIAEGQHVLVQMTIVRGSASTEQRPKDAEIHEFNSEEDKRLLEGIQQERSNSRGCGLLTTEGALADDDEWDAIMEEVHQSRRLERASGTIEQ
jgi:hypothetical protein